MKLLLRYALAASAALLSASAAAVGGPADLSVYDRSEGQTLPVYWHEGRPYVVGKPGNEYQLQLRNRQGDDILAVMSVDGVNVVQGLAQGPLAHRRVLPASAKAESRAADRDNSLGTGHGRSEYSPVRTVEFERDSSTPAEVIGVYCDSQADLVARGIVPPPRVAGRPLPRRFPSFVPDPPA